MMDDLKLEQFDFDSFNNEQHNKEPDIELEDKKGCGSCLAGTVKGKGMTRQAKNIYRRAFSELNLLEILGDEFKTGTSYHCISGGDIDSLSYLKAVIKQQDLDYLLFSTWCMADDDVLQFREWIEGGQIKRMDAYCGEIFPGSYNKQFIKLKDVVELCDGRLAICRNHAKIYAGIGKKFAFAIESSANINTNPRIENTAIHIGKDIYEFYKEFFDGITSFNRDYDNWKPWRKP